MLIYLSIPFWLMHSSVPSEERVNASCNPGSARAFVQRPIEQLEEAERLGWLFSWRKQPGLRSGFRRGRFKGRDFEAFTISWLPHDFDTNPHLCVFDGFGSRIDPKKNKCPISVGRNFRLDETLKLAVNAKNAVAMWGPYEIKKEAFDLGVKRKWLLDGGTIRYRADDRLYRKDRIAINCFHAMAGLEELYPNGGFLGTGFRMWGINSRINALPIFTSWHDPERDELGEDDYITLDLTIL